MATTATAASEPDEPKKGIFVEVHPHINTESVEQTALAVRNAVSGAIRDAVKDVLLGLSLTLDELAMLDKHREIKRATIERARAHINEGLNAGKAG